MKLTIYLESGKEERTINDLNDLKTILSAFEVPEWTAFELEGKFITTKSVAIQLDEPGLSALFGWDHATRRTRATIHQVSGPKQNNHASISRYEKRNGTFKARFW